MLTQSCKRYYSVNSCYVYMLVTFLLSLCLCRHVEGERSGWSWLEDQSSSVLAWRPYRHIWRERSACLRWENGALVEPKVTSQVSIEFWWGNCWHTNNDSNKASHGRVHIHVHVRLVILKGPSLDKVCIKDVQARVNIIAMTSEN